MQLKLRKLQQVKIKQLEGRLQESDKENLNLTNINDENQEEIDNLKTKCKALEDNLKYEKKKLNRKDRKLRRNYMNMKLR